MENLQNNFIIQQFIKKYPNLHFSDLEVWFSYNQLKYKAFNYSPAIFEKEIETYKPTIKTK